MQGPGFNPKKLKKIINKKSLGIYFQNKDRRKCHFWIPTFSNSISFVKNLVNFVFSTHKFL